MFFRKAKRIKELEEKVNQLEAINRYNASVPTTITRVKFETVCSKTDFPDFIPPEIRERVTKDNLMKDLKYSPYMKYEEYYDKLTSSYICNVSINIVTEAQ